MTTTLPFMKSSALLDLASQMIASSTTTAAKSKATTKTTTIDMTKTTKNTKTLILYRLGLILYQLRETCNNIQNDTSSPPTTTATTTTKATLIQKAYQKLIIEFQLMITNLPIRDIIILVWNSDLLIVIHDTTRRDNTSNNYNSEKNNVDHDKEKETTTTSSIIMDGLKSILGLCYHSDRICLAGSYAVVYFNNNNMGDDCNTNGNDYGIEKQQQREHEQQQQQNVIDTLVGSIRIWMLKLPENRDEHKKIKTFYSKYYLYYYAKV